MTTEAKAKLFDALVEASPQIIEALEAKATECAKMIATVQRSNLALSSPEFGCVDFGLSKIRVALEILKGEPVDFSGLIESYAANLPTPKFACHIDFQMDGSAGSCVLDTGDKAGCTFVQKHGHQARSHCEHWYPVVIHRKRNFA